MVLGLENKTGASVTSFNECFAKGENKDCDVEEEPL